MSGPTQIEEQEAKEFLKRAEIRTMKKDLQALRETDALKERDKIVKIKTLEEQRAEQAAALAKKEGIQLETEKTNLETVLSKNANQEHDAEKDLKEYATEEERQQIFILESQRISLEKQFDDIETKQEPALKLQKNKLLLDQKTLQDKLQPIVDQETKLENEQTLLTQKAQETTIAAERRSLEQRKSDIDKEIQEIEKKRWEVEKTVETSNNSIAEIDASSDKLVIEKSKLKDSILGMDKSLRQIYSGIIARTEEKRMGLAQEQLAAKEAVAKINADKKEQVQHQQYSQSPQQPGQREFLKQAPDSFKEKMDKEGQTEDEQREKFLQDVTNLAETGVKNKEQPPTPVDSITNKR